MHLQLFNLVAEPVDRLGLQSFCAFEVHRLRLKLIVMIAQISIKPYLKVFKLTLDIFLEGFVRNFLLLFTFIELFLQLVKSLI